MNNESDDQIRDILDDIPERLKLAEDGVDTSVQQEYLEYTEDIDFGQYSEEDLSARSHGLFSLGTPLKDKKETLAVLAHRGTLEAYRTIERFLETSEPMLEQQHLPHFAEPVGLRSAFREIHAACQTF